jgi:pimeloyl-ACP methyl ester carboxylesterase
MLIETERAITTPMTQYTLIAERSDDIPFLLLTPADARPSAPLVLVLHGLGGSKENVLPTAYAFAQQGFRVAALDARLHGDRPGADAREERMAASYIATLYEIITGTARDVSALLDHLGADRAAVHGISLGGYIIFSALLTEPRLAVAAVAMGSPDWLGPIRAMGIDLTHPALAPVLQAHPLDQAESAYPPRPLLMMHGTEDEVVPVSGVEMLYERLLPAYAQTPERLELILVPGLGHVYTPEMRDRSIVWTQRYL